MKTLLSILVLSIVLFSCKPTRYLEKHHVEICLDCIDEYIRDSIADVETVYTTDTVWVDVSENLIDSTYTELYFECDSNNQVLLTKIVKLKDSDKILSQYTFQNNVLRVLNKSYLDSIAELHITIDRLKNNVKIIEKPVIKEILPKWIYVTGGLFLLCLIILLILAIKK